MDDPTRQLVTLILEDGAKRHGSLLGEEIGDHIRTIALQERERARLAAERGYAGINPIENGLRYWIYIAKIYEKHAGQFIKQVGQEVRAETLHPEAGEMFRSEAVSFLDSLNEKFTHRYKCAKPFAPDMPSSYGDTWQRLRPEIDRKIEIECLKFNTEDRQVAESHEAEPRLIRADRLQEISQLLNIPVPDLAARPLNKNSANNTQDEIFIHEAARMVRAKEVAHLRTAITQLLNRRQRDFCHSVSYTDERNTVDRINDFGKIMYDPKSGCRLL